MLKPRTIFVSTFALVILIDQATKWWIAQSVEISYNTGISLGLFSVLPATILTLILVGILVLVWWVFRAEWRALPLASGLFFGGGVSNVIDRVSMGSVRDWLPVPYLAIYNNVADYAIAIGLLLLLVHSLWRNYQTEIDPVPSSPSREEAE